MPHSDIDRAADYLRRYLTEKSPKLTGALRRSWRTNVGRNAATVYSRLPWAYRALGDNRANRKVVDNGIRATRRAYPGYSYRKSRSRGTVTITIRHA